MIFLGTLYQPSEEKQILSKSKNGILNATNNFQIRLLDGFHQNHVDVKTINVLPVGIWKRHYQDLFLTTRQWKYHGKPCYEIGSINLPVIKQIWREISVKQKLKELTQTDSEIVIYATYLPFLRAVYKLSKHIKITLIVTDLPEYYDLGKISAFRKLLRKLNNHFVYSCLSRIDRFVLLTEAMKEPLAVKDRPYVVVEGIGYTEDSKTGSAMPTFAGEKEVIFYSGTLHYQYGIQNLLDAFSLYEDKNIELWICGAGEAQEAIETMSREDHRIRYFGYVSSERVKELRDQATVLINPRPNEGEYTKYSFPSKTMEYMASGIPVVMHKLSGIPDEYDQYLTYIHENTPAGIKEALDRIFALSPEVRQKMGAAAQTFIVQQKNEREQVKKMIDMICSF